MLSEKQVREQVWQIIDAEIQDALTHAKLGTLPKDYNSQRCSCSKFSESVFDYWKRKIREKINKVLNDNDAILVYQP